MFAFLLSNKLTLTITFRVKKPIISNAKLTTMAQRTEWGAIAKNSFQ